MRWQCIRFCLQQLLLNLYLLYLSLCEGFFIKSLSAILSFLVKLSVLCLSVFSISDLIRCRNVSRVLSDNLSRLKVWLRLGVKGSLGFV